MLVFQFQKAHSQGIKVPSRGHSTAGLGNAEDELVGMKPTWGGPLRAPCFVITRSFGMTTSVPPLRGELLSFKSRLARAKTPSQVQLD
jgi:hypothetical protein